MNIGIVGSSKATKEHYDQVYNIIKDLVDEFDNIKIFSGGATGIDTLVKDVCITEGIPMKPFPPSKPEWAEYKVRNEMIADHSDLVISIALAGKWCYHCKKTTHAKTAGCWTRNYAEEKGKQVRTIII